MVRRALILLALIVGPLAVAAPAHAAGRVTVANENGDAVADPTYATTVKLTGRGFQTIKGGHGGIYVFFGTVSGTWRPSQGGVTGEDYFYVPDGESKDNSGFQKYVAFPGSDTASSANGGTLKADGSWSTTLVIPGATFQAVDRSGAATTIDCRKVRCGVITVGAHGVVNGHNETFTPVTFKDLYGDSKPSSSATTTPTTSVPTPGTPTSGAPTSTPGSTTDASPSTPAAGDQVETTPVGPAALEVDRASATAGHVLPFTATGLPAGYQLTAVLDNGVAAAGPFVTTTSGQLAGVITLPADLTGGTHELRLYGVDDAPVVRFAVIAAPEASTATLSATETGGLDRAGIAFVAAAAAVLLAALGRLLLVRRRRSRHA